MGGLAVGSKRKKYRLKCHPNLRLIPYWVLEWFNHFLAEAIPRQKFTEAQNLLRLQDTYHMYELVNKSWLNIKSEMLFSFFLFDYLHHKDTYVVRNLKR